MSLPAASEHLRVLKQGGLVTERRVGRQRCYRLNPWPLREVADWARHFELFWSSRLSAGAASGAEASDGDQAARKGDILLEAVYPDPPERVWQALTIRSAWRSG